MLFLGLALAAGVFAPSHAARAAQVSSRSDTLSNSQPSATSNHTISFTTNNAIYGSSVSGSSTLKLAFPANFTVPSSLNCGDIDAATSSQFNFNYPACQQTSTAWGMSVTNSISFVQSASTLGIANGATSIAFLSNNTAGNLIVVSANWEVFGTITASIADSLGNLYATAVGPIVNSGGANPLRTQIWYARNIKGGPNTVTITYGGSSVSNDIEIHEYSGADTVSPLDVTASATGYSTSVTSGPATTNYAYELIFGAAGVVNGSGILGAGSTFTQRAALDNDASEDKLVSVAGAYSATFTITGIDYWNAGMATFKAAASVTFIPPSDTAVHVATGTPIIIKIGSNATYQQTGTHWITNPSTAGTYTISVGGTFGGSGNMLVSIGAARVAAFPATGILDNFNRSNQGPPPSANWSATIADNTAGRVVSNQWKPTTNANTNDGGYWNAASYGPDQEAYVTVVNVANNPGVGASINFFLRLNSPGTTAITGYMITISGPQGSGPNVLTVQRIDVFPQTIQIGATSVLALANGDTIGARMVGNTINVFRKPSGGSWAQVGGNYVDSKYAAGGYIGFDTWEWSNNGTWTIDDFGGGSISIPYLSAKATVAENLALTVAPSTGPATITYQSGGSGATYCASAGTCSITGLTFTAGQLIVVMVSQDVGDLPQGAGVTDTKGNSYTQDVAYPGNSLWKAYIYHAIVASGKDGSGINVTFSSNSSSDWLDIHVLAFSATNGWLSSPLDQKNNAGGDSQPTSPVTLTAGTTAQASELFAGFYNEAADGSPSSPDGWTRAFLVDSNTNASFYTAVSAIQSVSFRASDSANNGNKYAQLVATYMPAPVAACTADDGATVNAISTTATSIPFGTINTNTFYQGCQDVSVSTNAGGGYSLSVQEKNAMQTANGLYSIPDTACDSGTCNESSSGIWVTPTNYGFGHTCANISGSDCHPAYQNGTRFRKAALSSSNYGSISYVQETETNGAASGSTATTTMLFASAQTAGDLIVVALQYSSNQYVLSVTDTVGNVYRQAATSTIAYAGSHRIQIWYANNIQAAGAGANAVTTKYNTIPSDAMVIAAVEYSGADPGNPLDVTSTAVGLAGTYPDSGYATTHYPNELVFGNILFGLAGSCSDKGSGFNCRSNVWGNLVEDKFVSAIGRYDAVSTNNSYDWLASMATFRPAGGPTTLMWNTVPAASTGRIKFRLSAPQSQQAGTYSTVIIFTLLGTF